MTGHVAHTAPVAYVTFENAPENLVLKALCALSELNPRGVQRGYADLGRLQEAAARWQQIARRLALVEESSHLTVGHVVDRQGCECGAAGRMPGRGGRDGWGT